MKMILVDTDTIEKLVERNTSKGYNMVGEGFFSKVFLPKSGKYVWKVCTKCSGDAGYMAFLRLIAKGILKGIHFPRIKLVLHDGEDHFAVLMEKLEPVEKEDPVAKPVIWASYEFKSDRLPDSLWDRLSALKDTIAFALIDMMYGKDQEGCGLDMHFGNVMWRGNTLVITDPFTRW